MGDNNFSKKKEEVKKLLDTSVFISEEVRQSMFLKMDELSEDQLGAVSKTLLEAMDKQDALIGALSKDNPNFLFELKKTISNAKRDIFKEEESKENVKTSSEIQKLEEELNNSK